MGQREGEKRPEVALQGKVSSTGQHRAGPVPGTKFRPSAAASRNTWLEDVQWDERSGCRGPDVPDTAPAPQASLPSDRAAAPGLGASRSLRVGSPPARPSRAPAWGGPSPARPWRALSLPGRASAAGAAARGAEASGVWGPQGGRRRRASCRRVPHEGPRQRAQARPGAAPQAPARPGDPARLALSAGVAAPGAPGPPQPPGHFPAWPPGCPPAASWARPRLPAARRRADAEREAELCTLVGGRASEQGNFPAVSCPGVSGVSIEAVMRPVPYMPRRCLRAPVWEKGRVCAPRPRAGGEAPPSRAGRAGSRAAGPPEGRATAASLRPAHRLPQPDARPASEMCPSRPARGVTTMRVACWAATWLHWRQKTRQPPRPGRRRLRLR